MKLCCKLCLTRFGLALILSLGLGIEVNAQQYSDAGLPDGRSGLTHQFSDSPPAANRNPDEMAPPLPAMNFSDQTPLANEPAHSSLPAMPNHPMVQINPDGRIPQNSKATESNLNSTELAPMQMSELHSIQGADPYRNDMRRAKAGYPYAVNSRATTTYTDRYQGYFIGGGVPAGRHPFKQRGEPRYDNEGTWGMDYAPFYSRVASNWSHGRLFQGGTGQYEPDHKNRPFGQTYGKRFGNKERRFSEEHGSSEDH